MGPKMMEFLSSILFLGDIDDGRHLKEPPGMYKNLANY